ncbi:MAG: sugar ABC transporter ATP-binding protein [Gemmataceae bacterium]|nr:sugar ABC transporter ATP-binding protein [Gemmataceae bacterium]
MQLPKPVLEAQEISKRFQGVQALSQVELKIFPGEVLAIIGENGAGKSTLMKILAGVCFPDSGTVLVDGEQVVFSGPESAMAKGISLIHQELNLADNLTVAENLFLGREISSGGFLGLLNSRAMTTQAKTILQKVGLDISPATKVGSLSPGQKQLVEIARSLSLHGRVLIMDEPTSSLSQKEALRLEEVIRDLAKNGVSIVYISHRLAEVNRVADRVVALRDGKNSGGLAKSEIHHDAMVKLMVGRDLKKREKTPSQKISSTPRLQVSRLRLDIDQTEGISFSVHRGEIVGMAGLVGAGRTELAEALFGIRPCSGGRVLLDGVPFAFGDPKASINFGLLLVPEDRRNHGLILEQSIGQNLSLPNLEKLARCGLVSPARERRLAQESIDQLRIKTPGPNLPAGSLSGGNQQKVVLAKWLAANPKVLILDEPTRGVDVGSKAEIYDLMASLAEQGIAILMISSDMEEILRMSDRVLVMHEGILAGELTGDEVTEEGVMQLATGGAERVGK